MQRADRLAEPICSNMLHATVPRTGCKVKHERSSFYWAARRGRVTSVLKGSNCVPYQYSHGLKIFSYSWKSIKLSPLKTHWRRQLILAHGFALGSCLAPHVICKAVPVGLLCGCARRAGPVFCICGRLPCWRHLPRSSLHSGHADVCRTCST